MNVYQIARISPTRPTMMSTRPAVWMLKPFVLAVTANRRIAPMAIRKMEEPMVIVVGYPDRTASTRGAPLPLHLAHRVALLDRLALVVEVLAARERDLHLCPGARAGEVDPGRHEREPPLLGAADEPLDLPAVEQELARALGVVVGARRRPVGRDVDPVEPHLAVPDGGVGVLELGAAVAQRLDLGALEHDAALEALEQVVAEARLTVGGDVAGRRLALRSLGHENSFTPGRLPGAGRPSPGARRCARHGPLRYPPAGSRRRPAP